MKNLRKYVLALALAGLLIPSFLSADLLVLTDGRRLTGTFLKEVDELISFRTTEGEELSIPKSEVQKLSLGYTGSPMCLTTKESKRRRCNALLYKISKEKVWIAEGEGFLKLREVPIEEVEQVELKKADAQSARLTSSLPSGMQVVLKTKTGNIQGQVQKSNAESWTLKDTKGKLHTIPKEEIAAIVLEPHEPSFFDRDIKWWHIFPGAYQYTQGDKIKGLAIGSGFSVAIVGVLLEYQASVEAARAGSSDLTVIFFYNDSYKKSFEEHQAREKTYGIVAALIYMYHVVDYFYLGGYGPKGPTNKATAQTGFFLKTGASDFQERSLLFSSHHRRPNQAVELGFRYSF